MTISSIQQDPFSAGRHRELFKLSQTVVGRDCNSGIGKGTDCNGSKPSQTASAEARSLVSPSLSQAALRVAAALLTSQEATRVLNVSTDTVYRLCAQGELPQVRVANVIRIAPADGTLSYTKPHSGACSHHGGGAEWMKIASESIPALESAAKKHDQ